MKRIHLLMLMSLGLQLSAAIPAFSQGFELTLKEFQSLHQQLQPSEKDSWQTIPWKISLLDGQRTAAEERKPIFIWAMDGHPLGCT